MDETLEGWLAALASARPTPGGGSAAALLIATGAALVEMACNLTAGRERFSAVEPLMRESIVLAKAMRGEAATLRLADSAAYDAVSAAYALPRATAEEKGIRAAAIQQALRGATEVPMQQVQIGLAVLELAARIAEAANPNVISDVGAGALAARAGVDAAALNVRINLTLLKDPSYVEAQGSALASQMARAATTAAHVLDAVDAAIGGRG